MAELDRLIVEGRAALRQKGKALTDLTPVIVREYLAGKTTTALARTLGADPRAVLYRLQLAGIITPRQRARGIMAEKAEEIIADYLSGASLVAVGAKHGISERSVRRVLGCHKIRVRGFGPRKAESCKICGKRKVRGRRLCRRHCREMKARVRRDSYRRTHAVPPERWRIAA